MNKKTFHLIGNAHLDPVWLWDWAEGLNEGTITCRAILDLMDENPSLTFIRGEASIYEHIEQNEPALFERIRKFVAEGRWDIVGGTYVQPDNNLPSTETLVRHFTRGQNVLPVTFWEDGNRGLVCGLFRPSGRSAGNPKPGWNQRIRVHPARAF